MKAGADRRVGSGLAAIGFISLWVWVGMRLGFPTRLGAAAWGSLALGLLLWRDAADAGAAGRGGRATVLASALLFAIGAWVASASLQLLGLGGVLLGDQATRRGWLQLAGLPWLIALVCLPQGVMQDTVLVALQRGAVAMASWGLDLLRIPHLAQGVALELTNGTLWVEEACSGMRSLVTGLILLQAWFCSQRLGFRQSAVALAAAAVLLIGANGARILTTAVLQSAGHRDWTAGTRHDVIGWAWFGVAIALGAGLPRALSSLGGRGGRETPGAAGGQVACEDPAAATPDPEWRPAVGLQALWAGLPRVTCLAVAIMVGAAVLEIVEARGATGDATAAAVSVQGLEAGVMPLELAGWRREERATGSGFLEGFALHQQRWLYRKGGRRAWVAVDLPFPDIHPLPVCYAARDWQVLRNEALVPAGGTPLTLLELRSKNGDRPPLGVMFDHYDLRQKRFAGGLPSRLASRWENVLQHLGRSPTHPGQTQGPYCQMQVVAEGVAGIENPAGLDALRLFEAARIRLARSFEAP